MGLVVGMEPLAGMGSLAGPLLSTLTFIAETTPERRNNAGVPKQHRRSGRNRA